METILRFVRRFTLDLWHALIFAAQEYDSELQISKTPRQRLLIWIGIGILVFCGLTLLVFGIWQLLDSIKVDDIAPS